MNKFERLRSDAALLIEREFSGEKIMNIDSMKMAKFILSIKSYKLRTAVITSLRKEETNRLFKFEGGGKYVITKNEYKDTERRLKRHQPCKVIWPVYGPDYYEEIVGWD